MVLNAVVLFEISIAIVVLFYLGLIAGMPWGKAAMGGKFPGVFPPKIRVVAFVNILIIAFQGVIVAMRAGILFPELMGFSRIAIWFVVAYGALGTILNTITPSKIERIWVPVVLTMFVCSLIIAINSPVLG